jgi:PD-(D/E)XK nuclease superfamily
MSSNDKIVSNLCAALDQEPLFHMSLGSKELFHSNFLAWLADCFPEPAAAVFSPWTEPMPGEPARPSEREAGHLDLILYLPNLAPIAIENKVFSVPDEEQLDRYAESTLAQREAVGTRYGRVLLSLMSPGWTSYNNWRVLRYRELAKALSPHMADIRTADAFAGDLVEHYVVFISQLVELFEVLGTPDADEPLLLTDPVASDLKRARISAGVQKARASCVARQLRRAVAERGWSGTHVGYGFTDGMSLLEGFFPQGVGGKDQAGDELGWQLQGTQYRLAVKTGVLQGRAHRKEREAYVDERYSDWFDFKPLEAVAGIWGETHFNEVRGGRWNYQSYNPNFVYLYRPASQLTPSQIVELGLLYLDRARDVLITNAESAISIGRPSLARISTLETPTPE